MDVELSGQLLMMFLYNKLTMRRNRYSSLYFLLISIQKVHRQCNKKNNDLLKVKQLVTNHAPTICEKICCSVNKLNIFFYI